MEPAYTQRGIANSSDLARFYPVQSRRNAARLYELDALDPALEQQLRAALDEIQSALGGVPVVATAIADYYELPLADKLRLSTPAVDSHPAVPLDSLLVTYMDKDGAEYPLTAPHVFVDWHHALPVVNIEVPDDISDAKSSRPLWITYTGGYELLEDRVDALRDLVGIYINDANVNARIDTAVPLRQVILNRTQELAIC